MLDVAIWSEIYTLFEPLPGLDYVEVWLVQLLEEARFLARFDLDDMVEHLESWCPDYRGLLINLYEPIRDRFAR